MGHVMTAVLVTVLAAYALLAAGVLELVRPRERTRLSRRQRAIIHYYRA